MVRKASTGEAEPLNFCRACNATPGSCQCRGAEDDPLWWWVRHKIDGLHDRANPSPPLNRSPTMRRYDDDVCFAVTKPLDSKDAAEQHLGSLEEGRVGHIKSNQGQEPQKRPFRGRKRPSRRGIGVVACRGKQLAEVAATARLSRGSCC